MSDRFFTADTHFYHENILKHASRPWSDVTYMNERIIELWNNRVGPNDLVYHLGDVTFGRVEESYQLLKRLNGQLHVVRGNHDGVMDKIVRDYPNLVVTYGDYKELSINHRRVILFHYPIMSWNRAHVGSWHLHGHCHGNLTRSNGPMLDVGIDATPAFAPWSWDEIVDEMKTRTWMPIDHHGSIRTDMGGITKSPVDGGNEQLI